MEEATSAAPKAKAKVQRRVNGQDIDEEQFKVIMRDKTHDVACPAWLFGHWKLSGCVRHFNGLEPHKSYHTMPSAELAHQIHINKMDKGIIDMEPVAEAAKIAAVGFAIAASGFAIAAIMREWPRRN